MYLHVSNLLNENEVRIDWDPPLESTMVITSYEVAYSIYEDVNNMRSIRLNSNTTSFVIQDLSKYY